VVEALADGIFATVMTVLGLCLRVPVIAAPESLVQRVLVYVLSFVIFAVYWVGHHFEFEYVPRTDRPFIWLNDLFLLCIGLLRLTTALLGRFPLAQGSSPPRALNDRLSYMGGN